MMNTADMTNVVRLSEHPECVDTLPLSAQLQLADNYCREVSIGLLNNACVYPPMLFALWLTTDYRHSNLLFGSAIAAAVGVLMRLGLKVYRARMCRHSRETWLALVVVAQLLSQAPLGILLAHSIVRYGYTSWNFTIVFMWSIAITMGTIPTLAASFKLMLAPFLLVFGPSLFASLVRSDAHSRIFSLAICLLLGFLFVNGRRAYNQYWRYAVDRMRDAERNKALQEANRAAEAASQAKGAFLANMSHEIRTPMHGVLGMAELALGCKVDSDAKEYILALRSSAQSLLCLLNDILDLSKIETGRLELEKQPYFPWHVVEEARQTLSAQASLKGISLTSELVGPNLAITGDAFRLRQVLLNLIGNAVKFTSHGCVAVSLHVEPEGSGAVRLTFAVKDTGPGIPDESQQLIFQAFSQVDTSVTRKFGGTGLGLSICSRIAELMGGKIWVESEVGRGSCFSVAFVATVAQNVAQLIDSAQVGEAPPEAKQSSALRILLAEDNAMNQKLAIALLSRMGHTVELAQNGREAVDRYGASVFDVVLMDMQMPIMGGIEAASEIRRVEQAVHRGRTPIVALTAAAMSGDRERFLTAGMDSYLSKPFNPTELASILAKVAHSSMACRDEVPHDSH